MKKDRIKTISLREIKSSIKRFISLLVMSMLGVGVFVGIKMAAPDMLKSLDSYYDESNTYDIKIISTLGLTSNDIESLEKLTGVKEVYGTYSKDVLIKNNDKESVIKVHGITNDINEIVTTNGRLPKNNKEVVVEDYFLIKENLKIGDSITLKDDDNTFNEVKLTIVGTTRSPLYINAASTTSRGSTTLGTGKVNYYVYVNEDNFNIDYYTEIYLKVNDAKKQTTNSGTYKALVDNCIDEINKIKEERQNARFNEIYNGAKEKIDKKELEYLNEFNKVKIELSDAERSLLNAKTTLNLSKTKLDNANNELTSTKLKLDTAKQELDYYNEKLINSKKEIDVVKNVINEKLENYGLTLDDINKVKEQIVNIEVTIEDIKKIIPIDNPYYDEIINVIDKLYELDLYDKFMDFISNNITKEDLIESIPTNIEGYEEIINGINKLYDSNIYHEIKDYIVSNKYVDKIIENIPKDTLYYDEIVKVLEFYKENTSKLFELIEVIEKINDAEEEYYNGIILYNKAKEEYQNGYATYVSYYNNYQNGLSEYNNGLSKYNSNYNLYTTKLEEYYNSKKIFELEIKEAKNELDLIPKAKWYVYDRLDDSGYSSFISDGESVSNLSKIFPSIFFIVAVLISLISMSRMVEEDRMQIGTLKSLGFSNKHIRKKYILYSGSATLFGGLIGALLGFLLLPLYVFNIYKILHDIPYFKYDFNPTNTIIGIVIAIICICGTTLLTIRKVVKEKPSELMRPKAPTNGKRVFLERIPFLWDRIKFSNKITIRNLFRYKKRVLMTIGGILGCTAVMLVGFGIRDSIIEIPYKQYKEVNHFDEMIYLTGNINDEVLNNIFSSDNIKGRTDTFMGTVMVDVYSANLFVADDEQMLKNIVDLRDINTKKDLELMDNEIIISDKLSDFTNKKAGDKLSIKVSDTKTYEFIISAVCENYVGHYVFMNKKTYEENIGKYQTNVVYLNLKDKKEEDLLSKELLKSDNVISVISVDTTMKTVNDSLDSLNSVVLLLILLSGALSFVVLYNLSNINISERKREIATLKVLGFTDKEVDNYITKETIILTIIGILLGLGFGTFLTFIIIDTVEIEQVRFLHNINLSSYIITGILVLIFTLIVNKIIHFALKKIDMIESLKSVE